ncbi:MAG: family 10 glycosylhydrolase [Oscillospiraceae bacterium]|nr:family 10 glycosylhydrolase [Oscillospiraceae bacterium]
MKARWSILCFAFCLLLLWLIPVPRYDVSTSNPNQSTRRNENVTPYTPNEFVKGIWIASAWNIDFPSRSGMTATELQTEIDIMADTCAAWGVTDIFLQVRPFGDALYPSSIFPWSATVSGTEGVAPDAKFDPLQSWVKAAHARGMRLHAWINPYRLSTPSGISLFALQHLDLVVIHNGSLYLDPGNPASQNIILAGIAEILENYNVDGIHFDDYFYPSTHFNDSLIFARYGQSTEHAAWRKENVNALLRHSQAIAHYHGARFGVSPIGIWANADHHPNGSDTGGRQSLFAQYADTLTWIERGYVDYIAPQIYWERGHDLACFDILLPWWRDALQNSDVRLYIGLAAYKQTDEAFAEVWAANDELSAQRAIINSMDDVHGVIYFSYRDMVALMGGKND